MGGFSVCVCVCVCVCVLLSLSLSLSLSLCVCVCVFPPPHPQITSHTLPPTPPTHSTIHPASLDILLSPDIIDINQDPLGIPAELVWKQGPLEVYAGPLAHNARVAVLFNRLNTDSQYPTSNITVLWEQVGVEAGSVCRVRYVEGGGWGVRCMWG